MVSLRVALIFRPILLLILMHYVSGSISNHAEKFKLFVYFLVLVCCSARAQCRADHWQKGSYKMKDGKSQKSKMTAAEARRIEALWKQAISPPCFGDLKQEFEAAIARAVDQGEADPLEGVEMQPGDLPFGKRRSGTAPSQPPGGYELHLCSLLGVPPAELEARRQRALGRKPADDSHGSRNV